MVEEFRGTRCSAETEGGRKGPDWPREKGKAARTRGKIPTLFEENMLPTLFEENMLMQRCLGILHRVGRNADGERGGKTGAKRCLGLGDPGFG